MSAKPRRHQALHPANQFIPPWIDTIIACVNISLGFVPTEDAGRSVEHRNAEHRTQRQLVEPVEETAWLSTLPQPRCQSEI